MPTIPAYTINGFTRPELHLDSSGNIVLDPVATQFAATYGIRALYIGVPASTPYPPVPASLTTPSDANGSANSVAEGAAAGTAVGITASATNTTGEPVIYSLTADSSNGGFAINPTTGVVTVANAAKIDFESNPGHTYSITVEANDGILTSSQSFTIGVSNVAPTMPVDANAAANSVAEGAAVGTAVGITASSTDVNGPGVTWTLSTDSSGGGFAIDANGVITVADSSKIDYETAAGHAYTVTARASDGALTSSHIFTISV
jgi:large repetitive protein